MNIFVSVGEILTALLTELLIDTINDSLGAILNLGQRSLPDLNDTIRV